MTPAFKYQVGWNFRDQWSFDSKHTLVGDFNFDGRQDFARLGVNFMHLFISRGDGTFWQPVYKFPKGWNFERKKWATIGPLDLNGDYKADFIRAVRGSLLSCGFGCRRLTNRVCDCMYRMKSMCFLSFPSATTPIAGTAMATSRSHASVW